MVEWDNRKAEAGNGKPERIFGHVSEFIVMIHLILPVEVRLR